ncbi:hypothetical protein CEXT_97431, partial [Caerostris extrusa]
MKGKVGIACRARAEQESSSRLQEAATSFENSTPITLKVGIFVRSMWFHIAMRSKHDTADFLDCDGFEISEKCKIGVVIFQE